MVYWGGTEVENETLMCNGFNITKDGNLTATKELPMKKIH